MATVQMVILYLNSLPITCPDSLSRTRRQWNAQRNRRILQVNSRLTPMIHITQARMLQIENQIKGKRSSKTSIKPPFPHSCQSNRSWRNRHSSTVNWVGALLWQSTRSKTRSSLETVGIQELSLLVRQMIRSRNTCMVEKEVAKEITRLL